jgi:glutathione S-transferase
MVGDHISIADISHWGWIASAGVDIEFPHIKAWEKVAVEAREARAGPTHDQEGAEG